jgi:uncharacterized integral membrane protein (TIGR00697 family)
MSENKQSAKAGASWRFQALIAVFIGCLVAANLIAVKLIVVLGMVLPAAIVIFPVSYIVGDVLTEVYGYAQARRVIWLGFIANLTVVAAIALGQALPAAPFWQGQGAYEQILGQTPRILAASFAAYLVGEFANAYVLARLKLATEGRHLWLRTIGSTAIGQGIDSLIFMTAAFAFILPGPALAGAVLAQWLAKTAYEALATPMTYWVIGYLKRAEGIDAFDRDTRFSPFALS